MHNRLLVLHLPLEGTPVQVNETRRATSVPVGDQVSCRVASNQRQVVLGARPHFPSGVLPELLPYCVPSHDAQDCVFCASVGCFPKCLIQPRGGPLALCILQGKLA